MFTEQAGFSWIRFSGPRIDSQGNQSAAFEVRTGGSKIDHPKQLHYITIDQLDETIQPLGGTPHSLKLEGQEEKSETKDLTETEVSTDDTQNINTEDTYTEELVTEEDLLNNEFADLMNDETA